MSITFWMPQAPQKRVVPYPDMDPDYKEVRPVPPFVEISMTAGNANAILRLIHPESVDTDEDPHGMWDMDALAKVRASAIWALNTRAKESAYVDLFIDQSPGRAKMIVGGRDEEYVTRRLQDFLTLAEVAMEHGFEVCFG